MSHGITLRMKANRGEAHPHVQVVWWMGNRCRNTSYSIRVHGLVGAVERCYEARERAGAPLPPMPAYALAYMLTCTG